MGRTLAEATREGMITGEDLGDLTRHVGKDYAFEAPCESRRDVVLKGRFSLFPARRGLSIHSTNLLALHDLSTEILLPPSLTVSLVLAGRIDGNLDGMPIAHGVSEAGRPDGCVWSHSRPGRLRPRLGRGTLQRKVNISVDMDWLQASVGGLESETGAVERFCGRALAIRPWAPSARAVRLARRIVEPDDAPPFVQALRTESAAIAILAEALQSLSGGSAEASLNDNREIAVSRRDARRARLARDLIESHLPEAASLAEIAAEAGMSISTLQRVFKPLTGRTVVEYIRHRKLELARDAMLRDGATIGQATFLAGYTSTANFATAFKRAFGVSPSRYRG